MDESTALAEKLSSEGTAIAAYLADLRSADWGKPVYAEGATWTVRSVLAHLMTAERAFLKLFEQIRDRGRGVSEDFDVDRYNASQQRRTKDMSPSELVTAYGEARTQMITLVKSLGADDLDKRGRHPFLGVTTLREMIRMIYIHNKSHLRDIRRALSSHG